MFARESALRMAPEVLAQSYPGLLRRGVGPVLLYLSLTTHALQAQGVYQVSDRVKFLPSAGAVNDSPRAVAMEGEHIFLGVARSDVAGTDAGAIFVFRRSGATIVEEPTITSPDATPFGNFGTSLVVQGDLLAVGSPFVDNGATTSAGAVYLYRRVGSAWTFHSRLFASDGEHGDCFGATISISGPWMAIGAGDDDDAAPSNPSTNSGAVYMFQEVAPDLWIEQQKLVASDAAPDAYFATVALEGNDLFVGAVGDSEYGSNSGAVYLFQNSTGTWSQTAKLYPSGAPPGIRFGTSVAIDQGLFVASGPLVVPHVYTYEKIGNSWAEQGSISSPSANPMKFGESIATEAGNVVVGDLANGEMGPFAGAAYVFSLASDGTWQQQSLPVPSDIGDMNGFGGAVVLHGGALVVVSSTDDDNGPFSGSAYLFQPGAPTPYCQGKVNSLGCVPFVSAEGLPSVSDTAPFRILAHDAIVGEAGILVYGSSKSSLPFHGGTLCVKTPFTRLLPPKVAKLGGVQPCAGILFRNFNAVIQSGLDPELTLGHEVRAQWRQRDPMDATGFGDSLTNAVQFTVGP